MFKRKRLITFFLIVVIASGALYNFFQRRYVAPIIMYHSVTPLAAEGNKLAVTAATFERQMRFLKERRYNVLSLARLAELLKEGKRLPAKTIAITLDDGYKDNYLYAFPVLKKYGLPATMFIIINEVARPQNDRLSWQEIKEMQDSGLVSFGSHCLGPEPLVKIKSEEAVRREIFDSKKILEEKLGTPCLVFSYPEGMFNAKIRQWVIDAGYQAAVATNPGADYPDKDIFALKRLRISENSAILFVYAVETSGYYTFMKEWKKKRRE